MARLFVYGMIVAMSDLYRELNKMLDSNKSQQLNPSIDPSDFKSALDAYYEIMKRLVKAGDINGANTIANNVLSFTGLIEGLTFLFDYCYAHADLLRELAGSENFIERATTNKTVVKIGDIQLILEDRGVDSDYFGNNEFTYEDILVRSLDKDVLKLRLIGDSEFYVFDGKYNLQLFKPGQWVVETLNFCQQFAEAVKVNEESITRNYLRNKFL